MLYIILIYPVPSGYVKTNPTEAENILIVLTGQILNDCFALLGTGTGIQVRLQLCHSQRHNFDIQVYFGFLKLNTMRKKNSPEVVSWFL